MLDAHGHPNRILGLLGQIDRHLDGLGPVRDLGHGQIKQLAHAVVIAAPVKQVCHADQLVGVLRLLSKISRVFERLLDVGLGPAVHLDRHPKGLVHPRLELHPMKRLVFQVSQDRGVNLAELAHAIQARERLAQLVGIDPVLLARVIVRVVESKRIDLRARTRNRAGARIDFDQPRLVGRTRLLATALDIGIFPFGKDDQVFIGPDPLPGRRRASRRCAGLAPRGSRWFRSRPRKGLHHLLFF